MNKNLNKNCKWVFSTVLRKLGKLHYLIKLENGKIGKRHVHQLRTNEQNSDNVKSQLDLDSDVFDSYHTNQNVTEINKGGERPVDELQNSDCANNTVNAPAEEETEEIAQEQIRVGNQKEIFTNEQNLNTRPQRIRKKPSRYGDFFEPY